jgi:hypothetical protein
VSVVGISSIVEGHGEVRAIPVLLHRIAQAVDPDSDLRVTTPIRITRSRLIARPGELERAVQLAAAKVVRPGGILILVDSDDDCPAELGPALLGRARASRSDIPISVVVAKREFEGWFLACAESLRGFRGLLQGVESPSEPEAIRGAKEWLSRNMEGGRKYAETVDQVALTRAMSLEAARKADSFDKLYREVKALLGQLRGTGQ